MRSVKLLSILAPVLLISACSTFSGGKSHNAVIEPDAEAAQTQVAQLKVEVTRLKSENARLTNRLLELERENEKLSAENEKSSAQEEKQEEVAKADQPAPAPAVALRSGQPQTKAVVERANAPEIKQSDVPVQDAPRLVQPSFASTEAVFENEASDEIQTQSVLFGVHLASYRRIADAREGWRKLQRENPDELGLLEPRLEKVTIKGKGDFLRLIGGGFSSREKAAALCANLRQKGLYCNVTSFEGERLSLAEDGKS